MIFRKVEIWAFSCVYCGDQVDYAVPLDQLDEFHAIDESGDHRPVCCSCDFYRQEDLMARWRKPA